jgi:5-oxoprolinase (ATP-hydrolysing) subunit A
MLGEPGRWSRGAPNYSVPFCLYTRAVIAIDINADVGESGGYDERLMPSITSASVAAGFHAGGPSVLRATIRLARARGVAVGAHPGFPDRENFGRVDMAVTPAEVEDLVLYQIAAVSGVAAVEGGRLQHVKPHGALYNMAARDAGLAAAVARAVASFDRSLILFAPPHSQLVSAARAAGLRVAAEAFADRAYQRDGSLVPRHVPGAVIDDLDRVVSRAIVMASEQRVTAIDGTVLPLVVNTICVHGDTPGCDVLAVRLRAGLSAAGMTVQAIGVWLS